jgi:hypothetical protein
MLCARLQAVLRGATPSVERCLACDADGVHRWGGCRPKRVYDRARHAQGPMSPMCFAHHRPRKRGNAPRVATPIDLAREVLSGNPELEERTETFQLYHSVHSVPYGTEGLV